ncbi:hypothetical protein BDU57DRAFT_532549 [Ampelomyces quisqualis]|uniref:Uncharacterized protein n=1 Tax=Ampelomyces quisqualis TaxID=50730 RepID=A0A6A5QA91_AMPQU|nr:hypothetical protein BDU57DRAFT_532549 [Ampelomyces quisqualis]
MIKQMRPSILHAGLDKGARTTGAVEASALDSFASVNYIPRRLLYSTIAILILITYSVAYLYSSPVAPIHLILYLRLRDSRPPDFRQLLPRDMDNQPPHVKSFGDLSHLSETANGKVPRFTVTTRNDRVWIDEAPVSIHELSLENSTHNRKSEIPDDDIYPETPSHITTALVSIDSIIFVKDPGIGSYNELVGKTGRLGRGGIVS